ncbi:MAG: hypothetical protein AB7S74_18355, partial [Hyphomicrobium sp.]
MVIRFAAGVDPVVTSRAARHDARVAHLRSSERERTSVTGFARLRGWQVIGRLAGCCGAVVAGGA